MPLIGDTIRLSCVFHKFDGTVSDVNDIVLKIYDQREQQYGVSITGTDIVREDVGSYYYDYTIPSDVTILGKNSVMYYEFSGTLEGKSAIARKSFKRKWVE